MKNIKVVLNGKGGVGKTHISSLLAQIAAYRGLDFMYVEIDSTNKTADFYKNSEVFKGRIETILPGQAREKLYEVVYTAKKQGKLCIVDVGGGTDSASMIDRINESFAHMKNDIDFIIPFENNPMYMSVLKETYEELDSPENIYLVKNKVINFKQKSLKDEYIFFEGNKKRGVKSFRKELDPLNKVFEVFNSPENVGISLLHNECILDTAQTAIQYTREEADSIAMEEELDEYMELMVRYENAALCLEEIQKASDEFKELFDD
ncbi:MAG: hypothetical protein J7J31_00035 [Helicobacteraceae bacterium]|nr:hypothetical protein [Helicobacteraceae bacterium]